MKSLFDLILSESNHSQFVNEFTNPRCFEMMEV